MQNRKTPITTQRNQHGEGERSLNDKRHALRASRREDQAVLRDNLVKRHRNYDPLKANAITAVT
jgi:hypothetical protein